MRARVLKRRRTRARAHTSATTETEIRIDGTSRHAHTKKINSSETTAKSERVPDRTHYALGEVIMNWWKNCHTGTEEQTGAVGAPLNVRVRSSGCTTRVARRSAPAQAGGPAGWPEREGGSMRGCLRKFPDQPTSVDVLNCGIL